ncbi:MAG: HAD-IIIC family phosphatase [Clostridiales bacterium]|nr:HAD-IIIC family phosphatase [Clostridiales bacterium]
MFSQLKRLSRQDCEGAPRYRLALLGDCATQHLATALKGYARYTNLNLDVFDADYNQLDAQIMDQDSELYAFDADAVLLYMCAEKLQQAFYDTPAAGRSEFADQMFEKILAYWQTLCAKSRAVVLQFNFVSIDDGSFGSYALKTVDSFPFQLRKLNLRLAEGCQEHKNVFLIDLDSMQSRYGRRNTFEDKLFYIAKMPLSLEILPEAAKHVLDVIHALRGRVKKCVILDLDNTLWGGVVGDDGLNGIQIGELGGGPAFAQLQHWLKVLRERGILLAVCSKNNEDTAKEPFLHHPEMVLHLEDISMFVANWEDKASNIRHIQQTLNIGMESMVFLDDNPFERNLVRSMIPELTVPELPEDPALYTSYLQDLNLFETTSYSQDDAKRTRQYQEEAERTMLQASYESYDDYLAGLEMTATAKPFDAFHYPRIAQLTQRSNQFNLRTIRYTEGQIETLAASNNHITRYYTLRDKFGDYGLISVVVMDKQPGNTLFISEWLMSCRVLKRGMEEFIINDLISAAKENGYTCVVGEYIKTSKNAMVANIYERMGFRREGNQFTVDTADFVPNKTYIKEEQEL